VSSWHHKRALRHLPLLSPKPQINNGFGHQTTVRANRRRRGTLIHLMKTAYFLMDIIRYPSNLSA
jgi:hypothetical protein